MNEIKTAKVPWEEQREQTLKHYDEVSTIAHKWSSIVPQAINFYFDALRSEVSAENPLVPVKGVFADEPEESWNQYLQNIREFREERNRQVEVSADAEEAARTIIKHISDATLELAFVRHSLTTEDIVDSEASIKEQVEANEAFLEEVKEDILGCLTGDGDIELDPEELNTENCELLWLASLITEREAQKG